MAINYSYEINNVNSISQTMDVTYSSTGKDDITVGMVIPDITGSLEDTIKSNAPVAEWDNQLRSILTIEEGSTGTGSSNTAQEEEVLLTSYQDTLDTLTINLEESVKVIEEIVINNLRVERVYNRLSNLVGLKLIGPVKQATAQEGAVMFNSATAIISKAQSIGVTLIAQSSQSNVIDFLADTHIFSNTPVGTESLLLSPITGDEGKKFICSSIEFINKFTEAEDDQIAASTNPNVKKFYKQMLAANYIDITNPMTLGALDLLVALGLLTAARKLEVITAA